MEAECQPLLAFGPLAIVPPAGIDEQGTRQHHLQVSSLVLHCGEGNGHGCHVVDCVVYAFDTRQGDLNLHLR